jgi:hypothetical protein
MDLTHGFMDYGKMDHGLVKIQKIRVPKKWIIHLKKKHGF